MIDDAGLLRVRGRLQHADFLTAEQRNPIVLPREDHVTQLIVKACHKRGYHAFGVSHTLGELSSRYWIIAGREEVRAWEPPGCEVRAELYEAGNAGDGATTLVRFAHSAESL